MKIKTLFGGLQNAEVIESICKVINIKISRPFSIIISYRKSLYGLLCAGDCCDGLPVRCPERLRFLFH